MSTINIGDVAREAQTNSATALLNNGYIRIYTGSIPATPQTTASGTLLAELRCASTAFPASSSTGLATANSIASVTASNSGTAAWARVLKSDGTTAVFDCDVNTAGAIMNINSTSIASGAAVSITSFTIQSPA
jgi:hypothetical protein